MLSDIFFQQMVNYTKTEQEIIDFICRNPGTFLTASISQLAERLGISDASLSRLARHAGYRDYKELKAAVTGALSGAGPAEKLQGSLSGEKSGGLNAFLSWQQTCLQKTLEMIDRNAFEQAAEQISREYGCAVLCKGGHSLNDASDYLFDGQKGMWFRGERIHNPNTHGTGCTLSSAIASNLAKGYSMEDAVQKAKEYISGALGAMLDLGRGSGPLDHGFLLRKY